MSSLHLVLASGSPRRREILAGLGVEPTVRPVDIDETPREGESAASYVLRLASEKARECAEDGELILAADTVVTIDGGLLGKPADEEDAKDMLHRLAGRTHQVLTGVAVYDPGRGFEDSEAVATDVIFGRLSERDIAWYVGTGEPMDKAGAYAIQGLGALFVERIMGNYSNVVGLPVPTVRALLGRMGYQILGDRS
ncbi:MAG: Maf family protein [Thermoanaerobaculia bacterium]|nr:Maf family protein [Thermoanaerobaculia bacterium]